MLNLLWVSGDCTKPEKSINVTDLHLQLPELAATALLFKMVIRWIMDTADAGVLSKTQSAGIT